MDVKPFHDRIRNRDRKGRTPRSYDHMTPPDKVAVLLNEAARLTAEIDVAIPGWPVARGKQEGRI